MLPSVAALFTLFPRLLWKCLCMCVWVPNWRRNGLRLHREKCVVVGGWYKDSLCCPWRRMTFASGLICIPVHCAGMLLLLLAGLYFPDKTQSFKGVWAFAIVLFYCFFSVLSWFYFPPFWWIPIYLFPSPFQFAPHLYFCSLSLFAFVSFVNLGFVSQSSVFWIWSIDDEEFGCSKQNNLLSASIISGISGTGQSAERDRAK